LKISLLKKSGVWPREYFLISQKRKVLQKSSLRIFPKKWMWFINRAFNFQRKIIPLTHNQYTSTYKGQYIVFFNEEAIPQYNPKGEAYWGFAGLLTARG